MFKKTYDPLLVVVNYGRYDCYGSTKEDKTLFKILQKVGGINDSVPPGRYHFIVKRQGIFKIETSLIPIKN